ncbi:MAG: hypothetical protein E7653_02040 [Ruminococcaceae bacterium]|nr:hypothetical protein [Oscillospiraceae bacterium]
MKKVVIVLMSMVLLCTTVMIPVGAAMPEDNTVQPLWINTTSIDCTVGVIDGVGYAECVSRSQAGSSSIKTDIYVYVAIDNRWTYLTETHDIKYTRVSGVSCPFSVSVGCDYRADYTFTVTKNGVDEVITRTVYYTYNG